MKMRFVEVASLFLLPLSTRAAPCPLCRVPGGAITTPSKIVSIPGYPGEYSCRALEAAIPVIYDDSSEECEVVHQVSTICGCPRLEDSCTLCPDGSDVPDIHAPLPAFAPVFSGTTPKCDFVQAFLHSFDASDAFCATSQENAASLCGCPVADDSVTNATSDASVLFGDNTTDPGLFNPNGVGTLVFGGKTLDDEIRQERLARAAACLSIAGALMVILENLYNRKRLSSNLYNQIVVTMASFDIMYSVTAVLVNIPRPSDDTIYAHGERGNAGTCIAQGWTYQFSGLTSLLLNASLSTYYVMVIVYRYRDAQLMRVRPYMLGLPVVVGTILACASIPFISPTYNGCHVKPPSSKSNPLDIYTTSWASILGLFIVPGYFVIIYATVALLRVYTYVSNVSKNSKSWDFRRSIGTNTAIATGASSARAKHSTHNKNKLKKEVFYQSVLYLTALYLSWFVFLTMVVSGEHFLHRYYGLWCFLYFVTPLQGFLNALVYFRRRLVLYWSDVVVKASSWFREAQTSESEERAVSVQEQRAVEPNEDLVHANGETEEMKFGGTSSDDMQEALPESP